MRGIILAGGLGTRLHPLTLSISKQLLPIFDKPMIYYPLSTLMEENITEILCICTKLDIQNFKNLLGNGSRWGIKISYTIQNQPRGIAEAFIIGKKFIGKSSVALILGDNIFYGMENTSNKKINGAEIFVYKVIDPERYGVVEIQKGLAKSIVEKPKKPKSNFVVTGFYKYDNSVINIAESIKPSKRNELEITEINNIYLKNKLLKANILKGGSMWLDAGTFNSLLQASVYIQTIQERQNIQIGCPEEIAIKKNFISKKHLRKILIHSPNNSYYKYLNNFLTEI